MSKNKKLIKDTLIYAIGNISTKFLSFLMIPIYTLYFTPNEYGTWDIILTLTSMFIPILTLELGSGIYRWLLGVKDMESKSKVFTTGSLVILKNILIINIITIPIVLFYSFSLFSILMMLNCIIIFNFLQQCLRGFDQNKIFAEVGIFNSVFTILFNITFMYILHLRLESLIYSIILANIFSIIYMWIKFPFNKYISFKLFSKSLKKELLEYSLPMIPASISWWIITASDRLFIVNYLGTYENGLYSVANKIPSLITLFSSIFFLAWKDSVIREYDSQERDMYYSRVFKYYFNIMTIVVILLVLSSELIIKILVDNSFYDAWMYTGILLIASLFKMFSDFWGAGYHASKQTKSIMVTNIIGAITNIVLNAIFIKKFGLYAASLSTLISFLLMWGIRIWDPYKLFMIKINKKNFGFLLLLLCLSLVISLSNILYLNIFVIFVLVLSILIINAKNIEKTVKLFILKN